MEAEDDKISEINHSFNELDLQDNNGKYIIFAEEDLAKEMKILDENDKSELEPNFDRLSKIDKIKILLKALMLERQRLKEQDVNLLSMKKELSK